MNLTSFSTDKTDMRIAIIFFALLFCCPSFSQSPSDPPTENLLLVNDTIYLVRTAPYWQVVTDTIEFGLQIKAIDDEIAYLLVENERVLQRISDYKKLKEQRSTLILQKPKATKPTKKKPTTSKAPKTKN